MGLRIMIVEDSPVIRELLKAILLPFGHEVVAEVDTLDAALAAYWRTRPHVTTLDLSLPKEDGLSILKALREADPKAQVLVLTANSQERIREQLFQAGAVCVVEKPINPETLRLELERFGSQGAA